MKCLYLEYIKRNEGESINKKINSLNKKEKHLTFLVKCILGSFKLGYQNYFVKFRFPEITLQTIKQQRNHLIILINYKKLIISILTNPNIFISLEVIM